MKLFFCCKIKNGCLYYLKDEYFDALNDENLM